MVHGPGKNPAIRPALYPTQIATPTQIPTNGMRGHRPEACSYVSAHVSVIRETDPKAWYCWASANCPRTKAAHERVIPQVGQGSPVIRWNRQRSGNEAHLAGGRMAASRMTPTSRSSPIRTGCLFAEWQAVSIFDVVYSDENDIDQGPDSTAP